MNSGADYTVTIGRIARTLIYQDSKGPLTFTFDVDTVDGKNTVFLDRPSKTLIESEQARINLAYERVAQYLVSRGYVVEPFASS